MANWIDIAYGIGVGLSAPYWLLRPTARRKVLGALERRMARDLPQRDLSKSAVWIHAVSVGEINATRSLATQLKRARPDLHIILSATTDTGFARATELYSRASDVTVVRYPLDFSSAVERALDQLRPAVVVLMELEVWPNFVHACARRGIPVVLANGRLTLPSLRRYSLVKPVARAMFRKLAVVCAQDEVYAERFKQLRVAPERTVVTGTMKFDSAAIVDVVEGAPELARAVGLMLPPGVTATQAPVWVCGSTGPGEESIILAEYRKLLQRVPRLRLVIVPRHPPRFDEVARLIEGAGFKVVRRSNPVLQPVDAPISPVVLGDSIGDLRKFYSMADVVFVGRTLVDLGPRQHGSDMIEPAALGRAVIVGPYTGNFADAVRKFVAYEAMLVVVDGETLGESVRVLLGTPDQRLLMGHRAREVVEANRGATARHANLILNELADLEGTKNVVHEGHEGHEEEKKREN